MRKLIDIYITRVALVDKAANRKKFLLFKREESMDQKELEKKEKELKEKEDALSKKDTDLKVKEDDLKKKQDEIEKVQTGNADDLPAEIAAQALPKPVADAISMALKSLNTAVKGLAKLMGYGVGYGYGAAPAKEEGETEKTKKDDEAKALEDLVTGLAGTMKGMSEKMLTAEDVKGMVGEITGKTE